MGKNKSDLDKILGVFDECGVDYIYQPRIFNSEIIGATIKIVSDDNHDDYMYLVFSKGGNYEMSL